MRAAPTSKRSGATVCSVRSELGRFTATVPASHDLRDFGDPDFVLITFKSQQWTGVLPQFERDPARACRLRHAAKRLAVLVFTRTRRSKASTRAAAILRTIPYERIIGGVVHASGHRSASRVRESKRRHRSIRSANSTASTTRRISELSGAFAQAGLTAPIEPDIRRNIWRKLVNNLALNPVSALTRATVQNDAERSARARAAARHHRRRFDDSASVGRRTRRRCGRASANGRSTSRT